MNFCLNLFELILQSIAFILASFNLHLHLHMFFLRDFILLACICYLLGKVSQFYKIVVVL
jgi:hypothetical protein